jgi:c-di-GMP-binding flagellar brake protein YcgR
MGISLPRPEHRFRHQGLRPGLAITLHVESGDVVSNSITLVDEIGEERFAVLRSMSKLPADALPPGADVRVTYHHDGRRWGFDSKVLMSRHPELEFLTMPEAIEPAERREAYRLSTALKPVELFRLVVQGASGTDLARATTVVDVSELGICLSSRASIAPGERLGIRFELPGKTEIVARMVVRSIQPPAPGLRNHRVRCEFLSMPADTRSAIARFVMARQAELSRTGQL